MKFKLPKFRTKPTAEEEVGPTKRFSFNLSVASKYVLFIGDEGAILIYLKGKTVQSRQFVPDYSEASLAEFRQTLAGNTKAPLAVVIDSMDQSYIQQTLPPVGRMNVDKLIKRRLERDFGPDIIKGSVLLGREKTGRKDWNFLMVSLDKSPSMTAWLDFVSSLPNRLQGIYLVSIETEILLKRLEAAIGVPKKGTGAEWKFFVSHNKVGGFRQVMLRDGRIIFTRLALPSDDSTPQAIAANIEQECLSTIEYVRRLNFDPAGGFDVYIIAGAEITPLIDAAKFGASSFHTFSPYEVSQHLGITGATQRDDRFGDVILAAGIGSSRKHILTLNTPKTRQVDKFHIMILGQRGVAALAGVGLLIYGGMSIYDIIGEYSDADMLTLQKKSAQQELDDLRATIAKSGLDVTEATDMIDLYTRLLSENVTPLPLVIQLDGLVLSPAHIGQFSWELKDKEVSLPAASVPGKALPAPKITAIMSVEFPAMPENPETLHTLVKKTLADIKTAFSDYDITIPALPSEFTEEHSQDIRFDERPVPKSEGKALTLQITLNGPQAKPAAAHP